MPTIMQWKGRKFAFIAACLISIIGWLIAYSATTAGTLLVSESFHGLGNHCLLAVSLLSMSEMIAPKLRNISMVSFYLVQAFGIASVGVIARYLHWKTISLIMCSSMVIDFVSACTWPESPSWLAYKGEFDRCEKAFVWLRGTDENSKRELKELISAQKENKARTKNKKQTLKHCLEIMMRRDFYLPSLYMFLLMNLMYWSGTLVILIYSADIIKKATGNEEISAFVGIIVNIILFSGITTTSILLRYFSNKSVLLCSAFCTALSLACACVVTFLQSVETLPRDSLLCLYCVIAYMIANSLGVNSIIFSMAAELMPVKHRGLGGGLYVVFSCLLHTSSLKTYPYLSTYISLWGTFLIYAINTMVCGILIWRYVPETKGRTLQEIEDYYNDLCYIKRDTQSYVEEAILNDRLE
ncbi:Sugar transporter [Operophtera brumata]|uniref:Sugar transporter n=1 Tax=Operophtera brumata TaxID=104452 RepID=A0A0L7KUI7_OPEBR|nr:Sugar transporter [Operophtera brumata]